MPHLMTLEEFIARAETKHGKGKYGYSMVVYKGSNSKIKIECFECQEFFYQKAADHMYAGAGCPKCARKSCAAQQAFSTEEFVKKAIEVHGEKYGYDKVIYKNNRTNVLIDCLGCGKTFPQKAVHHLNGSGCPNCAEYGKEKHGLRYKKLYKTWLGIKTRCYNPHDLNYASYGGRGIKIADEWKNDAQAFVRWIEENLGSRPSSQHSLDRYPNNDGNYEPGNLRWATPQEQAENKSGPNHRKIIALETKIIEQEKQILAQKQQIEMLQLEIQKLKK